MAADPAERPGGKRANVFFLSSDLAETAQIRRIRSFAAAGHRVFSASTRKPGTLTIAPPDWTNIDLGVIGNENLGQRLRRAVAALPVLWRRRRDIAAADVIVARNIDMLALGWLARLFAGRRAALVYECLDIHGLMTAPGLKGRLARAAERFLLRRSALLVVSSPGFLASYFGPVQGHAGPSFLFENKLWFPAEPLPRPAPADHPPLAGRGFVLGWVGAIRCAPSLDLLLALAAARPDVTVLIRGVIHDHALPDFHARIARHPNVRYEGPFRYPDGLAEVYGAMDAVWAQDLWQRGTNSDWLLPNRIYEAGWFLCPPIAVDGSETARRVAASGGFTIAGPAAPALIALIDRLDDAALAAARVRLAALPDTALRQTGDEVQAVVDLALGAGPRPAPAPKAAT